MNTDHLVMIRDECQCRNCGASYRINMPVPVSIFEAIVSQFMKIHGECKKITLQEQAA